MPRYVIERDIPEIGSATREALRDAAHKSNSVLSEMRWRKRTFNGSTRMLLVAKPFAFILLTTRH
jgi:hypothetical protein